MDEIKNYIAALVKDGVNTDLPTIPPPKLAETLRPLSVRLAELLKRIPPEVQERGLSLRELQLRLKGRKKNTCHHAELAQELLRAGWIKRRPWVGADSPWPTLWFPPES